MYPEIPLLKLVIKKSFYSCWTCKTQPVNGTGLSWSLSGPHLANLHPCAGRSPRPRVRLKLLPVVVIRNQQPRRLQIPLSSSSKARILWHPSLSRMKRVRRFAQRQPSHSSAMPGCDYGDHSAGTKPRCLCVTMADVQLGQSLPLPPGE